MGTPTTTPDGGSQDRDSGPQDAVAGALKRQYHAALAMLRDTVDRFPEGRWTEPVAGSACWQVAYHALFFTHFYLHPSALAFEPFPGHQGAVQHADALAGPPEPESSLPLLPEPYAKAQVLAFADHLIATLDASVEALDLGAPDSGFPWYPMSKLEHQLVNLRHLAHHTGQLLERFRAVTASGIDWVSSDPRGGERAGEGDGREGDGREGRDRDSDGRDRDG
jgi:hypothetical protein